MKTWLALTVASVVVVGSVSSLRADCGSCKVAPEAEAKVVAPSCSVKAACGTNTSCGTKTSCSIKKSCGMAAALATLTLTEEQDAKIKAMIAKAGCGTEGACSGKKKGCMKQIKTILTEEQIKAFRKARHAGTGGKPCKKKAAAAAAVKAGS